MSVRFAALPMVLSLTAQWALAVSVIRVPQDAATIQAAVDRANPGDIVFVSPGVYREAVVINKSGIRLVADVPADAFFRGPEERVVLDGEAVREMGIHVLGRSDQPVRDVSIRGFFLRRYMRGVMLENVDESRVELIEAADMVDPARPTFPAGIALSRSSFNSLLSNYLHDINHTGFYLTNGSRFNVIRGNLLFRNHTPGDLHFGCSVDLTSGRSPESGNDYNVIVQNHGEWSDWGVGIFGPTPNVGNVIQQNVFHTNHRSAVHIFEPSNGNFILDNDATGNGLLHLAPSGRFDLWDDPPLNNRWQGNRAYSPLSPF